MRLKKVTPFAPVCCVCGKAYSEADLCPQNLIDRRGNGQINVVLEHMTDADHSTAFTDLHLACANKCDHQLRSKLEGPRNDIEGPPYVSLSWWVILQSIRIKPNRGVFWRDIIHQEHIGHTPYTETCLAKLRGLYVWLKENTVKPQEITFSKKYGPENF